MHEVEQQLDRQSSEADHKKRKQHVWEIERNLAEDGARPIIFYDRRATCWNPRVKGLTLMGNSLFNGWRMEDVGLAKKGGIDPIRSGTHGHLGQNPGGTDWGQSRPCAS